MDERGFAGSPRACTCSGVAGPVRWVCALHKAKHPPLQKVKHSPHTNDILHRSDSHHHADAGAVTAVSAAEHGNYCSVYQMK